jgi:hypothetical protein
MCSYKDTVKNNSYGVILTCFRSKVNSFLTNKDGYTEKHHIIPKSMGWIRGRTIIF